ncbi:organic cation transporter-like protein isoform X2 [Acropora palmata]|uniref:organic cation transporter-like protein isoform X2 n=1 Tax=Acropora palmata TaxID=6131 RepID=UPI003DA0F50F
MTLSVDGFLARIGSMGRFQWILVSIVGIMLVPVTFQTLIMTFLGLEPPWRCVKNSTVCNFTQEFSPSGSDPNKNFRCNIDDNEWEFTNPYTSIITEWRLVCRKSTLGFLTNSIMFFGWFIGNIVFGILSDKYGRRKVLFVSSSLVCWVAFASSFVPWYWLYACMRFIIGFGLGGAIVCLFIMATEYVGPDHRAMAGTFTWFFWTGALMIIALLAYLIRDWRKLSMVTSAPGLILMVFWMFVNAQVYFGVSLGSVMLGGNMYLNFFLTSLVEIPGNAFAIYSMNRWGRKKVVVIGLVVAAMANLIVTVIPDNRNSTGLIAGRIIFAMIGKFSVMNSFDAIFVFSAELFPTVVRSIGLGTSSATGRVGAITSPFVIWLSTYMTQLPYIIMAVDAFAAGVLCLLLPETNKEPTAEILDGHSTEALLSTRDDENEEDTQEKMTVM